jgi:hypothetical protein
MEIQQAIIHQLFSVGMVLLLDHLEIAAAQCIAVV